MLFLANDLGSTFGGSERTPNSRDNSPEPPSLPRQEVIKQAEKLPAGFEILGNIGENFTNT
jgi:hypothetical protein